MPNDTDRMPPASGHCQACDLGYETVYWLPDDVWAAITPKPETPGAGLLCWPCALKRMMRLDLLRSYYEINRTTWPSMSRRAALLDAVKLWWRTRHA
jgi:hypothetical protein